MKILYGVQKPDEGTIEVNGETVTFSTPSDAIAHGHRDGLPALPAGRQPDRPRERRARRREAARHRRRGPRRRSGRSPTQYGFGLDPDELVETLGVGERQRVEILKVLYRGAKIIILDEPTAVLVPAGGRRALRQPARAQGRGPHPDLHLPQARRGARDRRRHHRDPPRHDRRDRQARPRSPRSSSPS